jgi:alkanesulfonate monooxygenase
MILPATLQGELADEAGSTSGVTTGTAQHLSELCVRAEATGADSLWAVDHLFWPHPINECLTTLAIAAAATRRPALGACVLQLPLRQPAAVAKQATALQQLSGGRFVLGLGVGSHPIEYARAGVEYHRRGRLMDEGIAAMQRAWTSGHDAGASYPQQPTSARVPVWIGGSSPAARRRAAAVGDGWVPLFLTPDDYAPALLALRAETEAAGRDPDDVEPAVVVFARVGPDDEAPTQGAQWLSKMYGVPPKAFERHLVTGTADEVATRVADYRAVGAEHVAIYVTDDQPIDQFARLMAALDAAGIPAGR